MENMTPKQKKKLEKILRLSESGNTAILEYLFEIEEAIPEITDVISRLKGEKGDTYIITDKDRKEIAQVARSLFKDEELAQKAADMIEIPFDAIAEKASTYIKVPEPEKFDYKRIKNEVIADIKPPKDGKDADEIAVAEIVTDTIQENLPQFGEAFRDGLELLQGDARLDVSAIKGIDTKLNEFKGNSSQLFFGGGVGAIKEIVAGTNVTIDSTNPQFPIVSATGGGGGGGGTVTSVTSANGEVTVATTTTTPVITIVSAPKLTTARTIAGVSFDGTANISLNNNAITNGAGYTTNTGTVTSVTGTTNRITVATGTTTPVIDISASYVGQSSITTLGTVTTGVWQGTTIADTYISSAATWNGKFTLPSLTAGSVLFSDGSTIAQDNPNFFWDNTNNRLGIGTTIPSAALHVAGTGLISSDLSVLGIVYGYSGLYSFDGTNSYFGIISSGGTNKLSTTAGSTNRDISIAPGNAIALTAQVTTGYIGIGVTSPTALLQVGGSVDQVYSMKIGSLSGGYNGGDIQYIGAGGTVIGQLTCTYDISNQSRLDFGTYIGGMAIKMTILGNNVGIGQVTPTAVLHLKAGTATASTAPIKLTAGTALTTPEAGTMEFSNSEAGLTFTAVSTRKSIAFRNPIIQTLASSATPTPTASEDMMTITALAAGATFAAPTGTWTEGQGYKIRIKDNATARTLAFNAIYRGVGVTLPTTTTISKTMYIYMVYNVSDTKFDVLSWGVEA